MRKIIFSFNTAVLIAVLLGVITGFYVNIGFVSALSNAFSEVFVKFLKLISLPIIFLSIVATISGMDSFSEMKKLGKKVIKYTILTTILASTIALILFVVIAPPPATATASAAAAAPTELPSYFSFLSKIIPSNIVTAFNDNNNVMGIVFLAFLFSLAILALPKDERQTLHKFFSSLFSALRKLTQFVLFFMPLAIWAFVAIFVREMTTNGSEIKGLFLYFLCIVLANLIQGIIILPTLLKIRGISPWQTFKGMYQALLVAFFAKSSQIALPTTLECAQKNLKLSKRVSSFSLPLCTTINMNGCAAFILITVLYVSISNGVSFSTAEMISWVFISTIAAVGNAGIPMGCYFLASAFLANMGVPLHLLGAILPLYTLIDMEETALNVWSDSCVTTIVDKEIRKEEEICQKS